jgi:hypothetical protein
MYGYSNGGTVIAWVSTSILTTRCGVVPSLTLVKTTELQPFYALDVKIAGVAIGGLIPNSSYLMGTGVPSKDSSAKYLHLLQKSITTSPGPCLDLQPS